MAGADPPFGPLYRPFAADDLYLFGGSHIVPVARPDRPHFYPFLQQRIEAAYLRHNAVYWFGPGGYLVHNAGNAHVGFADVRRELGPELESSPRAIALTYFLMDMRNLHFVAKEGLSEDATWNRLCAMNPFLCADLGAPFDDDVARSWSLTKFLLEGGMDYEEFLEILEEMDHEDDFKFLNDAYDYFLANYESLN